MGPRHCVGASGQDEGKVGVRGEPPVGEHDVVGSEQAQEALEDAAFVTLEAGFRPLEQGPAGEAEASHHLHHRKATALLLRRGLREGLLVFGSVLQGDSGAVDNPHVMAEPALLLEDLALGLAGDLLVDRVQVFNGHPASRLAVGSGAGAGYGQLVLAAVALDLADRLQASSPRGKDLAEKGPEGDVEAVRPGS